MKPVVSSCPKITVYADGACENNPGPGGWGTIVEAHEDRFCLSGGFRETTNNRMEIKAALEGLRVLGPSPREVTIVSDSRYVVDAISKGWLPRWIRANFIKPDRTPRENADLWREMQKLLAPHRVIATWIRGHAGHPQNVMCDRMAVAARRRPGLPPDEGYEGRSMRNRSDGQLSLGV